MTDLIYDMFAQGVDMIVAAALLSSVVILLYTSSTLNAQISRQQSTTDTVMAVRKYNEFDNKIVYSADVISAIIGKTDDFYIYVLNDGSQLSTVGGTIKAERAYMVAYPIGSENNMITIENMAGKSSEAIRAIGRGLDNGQQKYLAYVGNYNIADGSAIVEADGSYDANCLIFIKQ